MVNAGRTDRMINTSLQNSYELLQTMASEANINHTPDRFELFKNITKKKLTLMRATLEGLLPFKVWDVDLPHNTDGEKRNSWNCVWISYPDNPEEDIKVSIDTETKIEILEPLLRHFLLEVLNETGGCRRSMYIGYAVNLCLLKSGPV